MQILNRITSSTRDLIQTIVRVIIVNWQVSPAIYLIQLILNIVLGLIPLLTAALAGLSLGAIASFIAGKAISHEYLYLLISAVVVTNLILTQLGYLESYVNELFQLRFDGHIQRQLFEKFASLDQTYYEDREFNNKLNKVNQNIFSMRSLNRQLFGVISAIVSLIAAGVAVFFLKPLLILIIMAALIPVLVIEVRTSVKRWRNWEVKGDDWRRQWNIRWLLLDVHRIKEIKLYLLNNFFLKKWQHNYDTTRKAEVEIERTAQRQRALSGFLDAATQIGIQLWLLTKILARNGFGLGQFVFYRQIIQNFSTAGSSLVTNVHSMQENSLYVNDYFEIIGLKSRLPMAKHPLTIKPSIPRIEFREVSFHYPGTKRDVVKHLSFVIEPGEDVALVGENGAGKSTIVKLLLRFYDPSEGQILVDNQDVREIDQKDWYSRVGVLFQDFNHYTDFSVSDNISVGRVDAAGNKEAVRQAAIMAGAEPFIMDFEHKFKNILSRSYKGGVDPSGGQWQRIALARAFYRQANILILDEPTSAIDAKGEYEIFQRIAQTQKGKTTIIISHRFSTVRNAHKIIVLDEGKIAQSGSHKELLAQGGLYKTMFELQAEGYR